MLPIWLYIDIDVAHKQKNNLEIHYYSFLINR